MRALSRTDRNAYGTLICRGMSIGVLACAFLASARADDIDAYKSLIDNSPFLTQAFRSQLGRRDRSAIQFRGYTKVDNVWQFGLFDTKTGKPYWLKLNEEEDHILVEKFNPQGERLFIKVDGLGVELRLQDKVNER